MSDSRTVESHSVACLDKALCTGCGACEQICPTGAIAVLQDDFGFLRANVDESACVHCGFCVKGCVALNAHFGNVENPGCFAAMASDEIRRISSSGGVFTVAAQEILARDGQVCGAVLTEDLDVRHTFTADEGGLAAMRGSKYMQSVTGGAYPRVKELLDREIPVLFTGMPCQVAGLKAYLGKDCAQLFCIDIFCHGITSAKVFHKYWLNVLEGKKITRLEFKAKEPWGWHAGVNAWFEAGGKYSSPLERDPFFVAYLNNLSKNSACASCPVNRLPRQGDWSIGDFWGVGKFDPQLNDRKGTSAILVNNTKGEEFLATVRDRFKTCVEAPLDVAIAGNGCITHPYGHHKNRALFYANFERLPFRGLTGGCMNNRLYEQEYLELIKTVPVEDHTLYHLAQFAASHAQGRAIVTWIRSQRFEQILNKYFGLAVAFGVTMRPEAVVKGKIDLFDVLRDRSEQYFLVSLDRAYDEESYQKLKEFGYKVNEDFIFLKFKPIVLDNVKLGAGNYYDEYGNSIEGFGATIGNVVLRGFNNHIMFGKNLQGGRHLSFDLGANAIIEIGDNALFTDTTRFEFKGHEAQASLRIGNNCKFWARGLFRFYPPGSAVIGDSCTSSSDFEVHVNMGKKVIVGRDCMFSYGNELWAGDGHAIFDVRTEKRINGVKPGVRRSADMLVLGDHVWVGKEAFLVHGTNVGDGSIIGARSLVKGNFFNNVVLVGSPARMVHEDRAWGRDGLNENMASCGSSDNARLTSHALPPIAGQRVLVVGGTRYMGRHLVRRLLELDNDVTIATRGLTADEFGIHVQRLRLDVNNGDSVRRALHGKSYDVVFNNLAFSAFMTDNILTSIECERYVQLSSVAVYKQRIIGMLESLFNPSKYMYDLNSIGYETKVNPVYSEGKRQAEAVVVQKFKKISSILVRIPYVAPTPRLYFYCKSILKNEKMQINDISSGMAFVQDHAVGRFLPWIAAQKFTGPINFASEGMVTLGMIFDYIKEKTGKEALYDATSGIGSPFNELTFSLDIERVRNLGYNVPGINSWFWRMLDGDIARAKKEFGIN